MKFLIAPNAFKGTIDAEKAAHIIRRSLAEEISDLEAELCPIADGGDGTCQLLARELKLNEYLFPALNARGRPVLGSIYLNISQDTALLDISTVSGLKGLTPYEIDAHLSSSYGTGELIVQAMRMGVKHFIVGLGGSATIDMGTGILSALGFHFLDNKGREIPLFSPGFLAKISHIQNPIKPPKIDFTCLCDVRNLFFGRDGAIPIFGSQKGLKPEEYKAFEEVSLDVFDLLKAKSTLDLKDREGFGAAGGIALGLSAFFQVKMEPGAKFFFQQVDMERRVMKADWVITGEGRYDMQSSGGKGSYELLQLAKKHQKKTMLVTSGEEGKESGFDVVIQIQDLDFNSPRFQKQAEKNLLEGVKKFIKKEIKD